MNKKFYKLPKTISVVLVIMTTIALILVTWVPANAWYQINLIGNWHRLNPYQGGPTPEHEILLCRGNFRQYCIYDKVPEPRLGFEFPPDSTYGRYLGMEITNNWECPSWFPNNICDNTVFVSGGEMNFVLPDSSPLIVNEELIVTEINGGKMLFVYWVDQGFVCPWFTSFEEALAANPFPLPFNGEDWPAGDCIFK